MATLQLNKAVMFMTAHEVKEDRNGFFAPKRLTNVSISAGELSVGLTGWIQRINHNRTPK